MTTYFQSIIYSFGKFEKRVLVASKQVPVASERVGVASEGVPVASQRGQMRYEFTRVDYYDARQ